MASKLFITYGPFESDEALPCRYVLRFLLPLRRPSANNGTPNYIPTRVISNEMTSRSPDIRAHLGNYDDRRKSSSPVSFASQVLL